MKACIFLADGFEEIEGLTVIDLFRRENIDIVSVSLTSDLVVHGAHDIQVIADTTFNEVDYSQIEMIILPGGGVGTKNLEKHQGLLKVIATFDKEQKYIAAICAAPSILGKMKLLKGRKATCYPGFEKYLIGAQTTTDTTVCDAHIITSRGLGTAIDFSCQLITLITNSDCAQSLKESIIYNH